MSPARLTGILFRHCAPVGMLVVGAACSEDSASESDASTLAHSTVLVSSPFYSTASVAASTVGGKAWVSMVPGTVPNGRTVTIQNALGAPTTVPVVEGGFDPAGILADVGDTLTVVVEREGGDLVTGHMRVPARSHPRVVRVSPDNHKTAVPLNVRVTVVFSQPVDASTLGEGVRLLRDGVLVAGTVTPVATASGLLIVEFVPTTALDPLTTYQLDVATTVRDVNGVPLDLPVQLTFTTESAAAAGDVQAPVVTIVSPANGATTAPRLVTIVVTASDDRIITSLWLNLVNGPSAVLGRVSGWEWDPLEAPATKSAGLTVRVPFDLLPNETYTWRATAKDSSGNTSVSLPVTTTVDAVQSDQLLEVNSFSMLEYLADGSRGLWSFVPQITLTVLPGASGVEVQGFDILEMPVPATYPWTGPCLKWALADGQQLELFGGPLFGYDYQGPSPAGNAKARLYYRDRAGHYYELEMVGPMVQGTWPPVPFPQTNPNNFCG